MCIYVCINIFIYNTRDMYSRLHTFELFSTIECIQSMVLAGCVQAAGVRLYFLASSCKWTSKWP